MVTSEATTSQAEGWVTHGSLSEILASPPRAPRGAALTMVQPLTYTALVALRITSMGSEAKKSLLMRATNSTMSPI